ncbi:MAG: recombinase family protein [Anaerovoracaceae bacterium]
MKKITKIERINDKYSKVKLRVAAYCRVSTASDEQLISLDTQRVHYEDYIKSNSDWEYAGIFYDEGITGTKKECRDGLNSLIDSCEKGLVDLVITKSISRFSRNTTDCLELVRKLIDLKVAVIFEKENINTNTMESELMLSILSSLAEGESVSISENNKWSIQKRFQNGTYIISYPPYGYENAGGEMIVVPEQAEVVKKIFEDTLDGKSTRAIAKELNDGGVKSKKGGKWTPGAINAIIRNEKFTGDVIFQKTYTDSQFSRHTNDGELNQYLCENHHESIVSHEIFDKANGVLNQRGREKGNGERTERYQNRYGFSGKIKCSECGGVFKRRIHYKPSGSYIAWCCTRHIEDRHSCSMKYITDDGIKAAFLTMMNKLIFAHQSILKPLLYSLQGFDDKNRLLQIQEYETKLEKNMEERQVLTTVMASGLLEPSLFSKKITTLTLEEKRLQEEKKQMINTVSGDRTKIEALEKLMKFALGNKMLTEYSDEIFLSHVEGAIVLSREEIVFELKCGLKLKERLVG